MPARNKIEITKIRIEDDVYLVNLQRGYNWSLKDYQFNDVEIILTDDGWKKLADVIQDILLASGDNKENQYE